MGRVSKEKHAEYQRALRKTNPESFSKAQYIYYRTEKGLYKRDKQRVRPYGITVDDWYRMLEQQRNRCAICGKPETHPKRTYLSIDHDHLTGKVRGLLCYYCNTGLGNFKDDILSLESAISYLQEAQNG
jgi:hypothetical protein